MRILKRLLPTFASMASSNSPTPKSAAVFGPIKIALSQVSFRSGQAFRSQPLLLKRPSSTL